MQPILPAAILALLMIVNPLPTPAPEGFTALFNRSDLTGWQNYTRKGEKSRDRV